MTLWQTPKGSSNSQLSSSLSYIQIWGPEGCVGTSTLSFPNLTHSLSTNSMLMKGHQKRVEEMKGKKTPLRSVSVQMLLGSIMSKTMRSKTAQLYLSA